MDERLETAKSVLANGFTLTEETCPHRWELEMWCPCGCGQGLRKCEKCNTSQMFKTVEIERLQL